MQFAKKNSYDIIRLFLNQIALSFFGLILLFATGMANDGKVGTISLVTSIFSVLFYLYILYATLNELGMKDAIKIEAGTLKADSCRGLKLILWAQSPNFIVVLLMALGWIISYPLGAPNAGLNLYTVAMVILHFLQAMYQGIIQFFFPSAVDMWDALWVLLLYIASLIPQILVCWLSYYLGTKNIKLFFGKAPTSHNNTSSI